MEKQEIINQINNLRTEIRNSYEEIGNEFYKVIILLDEYLKHINKGLGEKDI